MKTIVVYLAYDYEREIPMYLKLDISKNLIIDKDNIKKMLSKGGLIYLLLLATENYAGKYLILDIEDIYTNGKTIFKTSDEDSYIEPAKIKNAVNKYIDYWVL